MKLPIPLSFEWDEGNNDKNWNRHRVYFKEIEEVFFNRPIKFFPDKKHSDKEKRYIALGKTNSGILLLVIFTIRSEKIRVISARGQNKKERRKYEEET